MPGLKIVTHLLDRRQSGLRNMQESGKVILGTFFPRPALKDFLRRVESGRPGVYILLGATAEADDPAEEEAYIGESERVGNRLQTHEVQKDFWSHAAVFTTTDNTLGKTQTRFLEASLIAEAKSAARTTLRNVAVTSLPKLAEPDQDELEQLLADIRMLLGVAGIQLLRSRTGDAQSTDQVFELSHKDAKAMMIRTKTGYEVRKGSTAVTNLAQSEHWQNAHPYVGAARQRLVEAGILAKHASGLWQFTDNYEFESSSRAAMVICGADASGPRSWKLPDGKTLKQVEESETATSQ